MKVRIPKHREFIVNMDEKDPKYNECWHKLNQVVTDYQKKQGNGVFHETFIEDNEEKVKELQKEYNFTYTIEIVE